jgi:hypothetical protein
MQAIAIEPAVEPDSNSGTRFPVLNEYYRTLHVGRSPSRI